MKKFIALLALICVSNFSFGSQIIIPMDESQSNHLKAYGLSFYLLENGVVIEWLLNYRGGSFLTPHLETIEEELIIRGISYEILADGQVNGIKREIGSPEVNMEIVQLEKAPKIAVYTPGGKQPWDDAVTMVLEYAEIPYDKIYDSTIIATNQGAVRRGAASVNLDINHPDIEEYLEIRRPKGDIRNWW